MKIREKKEPPQHYDKLGNAINLDDCVAFPQNNSLTVGKVVKINNKMVGIEGLSSGRRSGYYNKYPSDIVLVDPASVTLAMLKGTI